MMMLENQTFDETDQFISEKVSGAGVIPICVVNGKIKLLLGKERFVSNWRSSLKWSGFEGGKKATEKINMTAAREFFEESMGVVCLENMFKNTCIEDILEIINKKEYFMKIVLCINHKEKEEIDKRYQVCYLIEVPYQPDCNDKFQLIRKQLLTIDVNISYFDTFLNILNGTFPYLKENDLFQLETITSIRNVNIRSNTLYVELMTDETKKRSFTYTFDDYEVEDALFYQKWFVLRQQIHNEIESVKWLKNSVFAERNSDGCFMKGKVNHDYLEKQQIKWWDMNDLYEVIAGGGCCRSEYFRAYFLPILQQTLKELKKFS
jgi:hypothetical protein